ncbi:MAG: hypothetical protein V3V01_15800 [Acidimicrobiales bacterium]
MSSVAVTIASRASWLAPLVVVAMLLPGCGSDSGSSGVQPGSATVEITAVAGPICPVESDPPSPECAAQPVEGAVIVVNNAAGDEIGRGTTDADGEVAIAVAPGEVIVVPQPVDGYMGTAKATDITLVDDQTAQIAVDYDTGIR